MRGDPSAEALSYKQVSRSASEPLSLSPVNSKTPCGQRVIMREAEKKRRIRFAARKAWRGIEGRRVWKAASGTWETCGAKASAGVGRAHSSGEAGQCLWVSPERQRVAKRCPSRGAKGLCVKKEGKGHEDKKYIARKGCQRGQSADDAASRKPLVQVERCRRDQSETILKRFGERER